MLKAFNFFTFIDAEVRSLMFFSYFTNNRIQTDLPLKMIHVSLIHATEWNRVFVFRIDLFEKW